MSVLLSDIRQKMADTAAAVTVTPYVFSSGRCVLGWLPFDSGNTFFDSILTDGPFLNVLPGGKNSDYGEGMKKTPPAEYEIPTQLFIGFDRNTPNDFKTIENFVNAIVGAWRASGLIVINAPFSPPVISQKRQTAIALYSMIAVVVGGT